MHNFSQKYSHSIHLVYVGPDIVYYLIFSEGLSWTQVGHFVDSFSFVVICADAIFGKRVALLLDRGCKLSMLFHTFTYNKYTTDLQAGTLNGKIVSKTNWGQRRGRNLGNWGREASLGKRRRMPAELPHSQNTGMLVSLVSSHSVLACGRIQREYIVTSHSERYKDTHVLLSCSGGHGMIDQNSLDRHRLFLQERRQGKDTMMEWSSSSAQ